MKVELFILLSSSGGSSGSWSDGEDSNTIVAIRKSSEEDNSNTIVAIRRFCCSYSCDGVLDASYKCNVCSMRMCEFCYSRCEEGHKCNYIIKLCPCCKEYITKDDGCNSIKCVKCNTFFDWNSRNIINNKIDYGINIQFMKILPSFNKLDLSSFCDGDTITLHGMYDHIFEFIRLYKQKLIDVLQSYNNYYIDNMKNIIISYLINKINLIQFERRINKIVKKNFYKKFIIKIILLAYDKSIDVFNNENSYLDELNNIINNTNNILKDIAKYLKYNNNIKIHHWFNLDGIKLLL